MSSADLARPRGWYRVAAQLRGRWVVERDLSERTRELYRGSLCRQIAPYIGDPDLPARVRSRPQELIKAGDGASSVTKAYRLLRAVLNIATDDGRQRAMADGGN